MALSQFISSFIVGYLTSWELSLVLTMMLPLLGIGGWFMAKAMDQGQATNESYINAGAMAQEILKEIKTVASFANFDYEKERYKSFNETAMNNGIKQGFKAGFGIGFIVFIIYNSYAIAVGYGSYLIKNGTVNKNSGNAFGSGDVIIVLFSIIFGCFSLGQSTPHLNAIISACRSAKSLFHLLSRKPKIDLSSSKLKPEKNLFRGKITFKDICFSYPSNREKLILDNFNLTIEPGQKIAIVGESGSGKSTVINLIERLYDPISGKIFLDDYEIKELDIGYLRSLYGYVPQQPVLLNTSIKENIVFGRENISEEDVLEAVENSQALEFVREKGLDYNVGAGGKILSGGQKQRIAIARSIINKQKILIFDEATSALDNICEKEVQKTLDSVCKDITSISIAHRISTIINADLIVCLNNGKIIDKGTHEELKQRSPFYLHLINQEEEDEEYENEEYENEDEHEENKIENESYWKKDQSFDNENASNKNNLEKILNVNDLNGKKIESENKIETKKNSYSRKNKDNFNILNDSYSIRTDNLNDSINNYKNNNNKNNNNNNNIINPLNDDNLILEKKKSIYDSRKFSKISLGLDRRTSQMSRRSSKRRKTEILKAQELLDYNLAKKKHEEEQVIFTDEKFKSSRKRLFELLKDKKKFLIGAGISAGLNGAVWPMYGVLLAQAIGTLSQRDIELVHSGGLKISLFFFILAISASIILWSQK
jgi:ABC-type multidrug transport system fused ATPase/permease subunit